MTRRQPRADVAVYAPLAWPLYEREPRAVGGAEVQSAYIARALAADGLRVRHVVAAADGVSERDGVEVVRLPATYASGGIARRRAVLDGLRRAHARVYVQRSAGFETGVVALYARAAQRRSIFSSSSQADFDLRPETRDVAGAAMDHWPTRLQYRLGLRLVDRVVVQTEAQLELACRRGVEARVIRSFCPRVPKREGQREFFLWIGGLGDVKDPLNYAELARVVPEAAFAMVATERTEGSSPLGRTLRERAESIPNLRLLPPQGREEIFGLYARAVAVVNTSLLEGFPNTFLEGWASGAPALSLHVDPDSVIERNGLGVACRGSFDAFAAAARRLWADRAAFDGDHLRRYTSRFHDPAVVGAEWAALVRELIAR
jgi:glycosyltransferase involved in cell wall biosynthesis